MAANGEVEGPDDHGRQGPRARNIDWVPRPQTDDASRPPPTIVRAHAPVGDVHMTKNATPKATNINRKTK